MEPCFLSSRCFFLGEGGGGGITRYVLIEFDKREVPYCNPPPMASVNEQFEKVKAE